MNQEHVVVGVGEQAATQTAKYLWQLDEVKQQLDLGKPVSVTVRQFLNWFGYARRGRWVVREIRDALHERGLHTHPDFEYAWIDGPLMFLQAHTNSQSVPEGAQDTVSRNGDDSPSVTTGVSGVANRSTPQNSYADPTYRIGKLPFANRQPITVHPDSDVTEALTLMLRHDFSQLPVMTNERDVRGLISWKSMAVRSRMGGLCEVVRHCMGDPPEIFDDDTSLFRVIHAIVEHECILVRDKTRKIKGVITASDLSETFHSLGRPFLLLGEIENLIRGLLDGKFSCEELQEIRKSDDTGRTVQDVSDLTFGDYVRLIQEPSRWNRLGLRIDRTTFVKDLEKVNVIRNDVMHFDPEGITSDELDDLRKTAKFLQEIHAAHQPPATT